MLNNPNAEIFKFCPKCGSSSLEENDVKSFNCADCGLIFYLNTAAAAVALIFDDQNKILTVVRKHNPFKGTYDLPGGFADPNETIEETIKREVKEELNLDITELKYFDSEPNEYHYKKVDYTTLDMVFLCKVKNFNNIIPNDDVESFKFLTKEELNPSDFGLFSIRNIVKKLIQNYPKDPADI